MSYLFLASPYSSSSKNVEYRRYCMARGACANAFRAGLHVFSPIVHWHETAVAHNLPTAHEPWLALNRSFLEKASGLWVLTLPGWEVSTGVASEIAYAESLNLPIFRSRHVPQA